jgi:cystathionine beta-lyase/cystathionine gamma-synthase
MERISALNQNDGRNSKPAYSDFPDIATLIMESFKGGNPHRSLAAAAIPGTTHSFESTDAVIAYQEKRAETGTFEYSRSGNPTLAKLESGLAALYGGDWALATTSGMNALNSLILGTAVSGDHVFLGNDSYRRTKSVFPAFFNRLGIQETIINPYDLNQLEDSFREQNGVKLLLLEIPTNPRQRVADLEQVIKIAHRYGCMVAVDTTLASPYNIRALDWGADFVFDSATKYLGGHHDLLMGVVAGRADFRDRFKDVRSFGIAGSPSAADEVLLIRSLMTLEVRMERHAENALKVAEFLESHPAIRQVWYPGLESHEDYALAQKYLRTPGGLITFSVKGGFEAAKLVVDSVRVPQIAPSLGGAFSLIEQNLVMSYWNASQEVRDEARIDGSMVRYAVGLENAELLINDLDQALMGV